MGAALDICASTRHKIIQESPKLCAVHRKENVETVEELKLPRIFPAGELVYRKKRRRNRFRRKLRRSNRKKQISSSYV